MEILFIFLVMVAMSVMMDMMGSMMRRGRMWATVTPEKKS